MTTKRTLSAALAALVLAVAGCGGADGGSGDTLDTKEGSGENSGAAGESYTTEQP